MKARNVIGDLEHQGSSSIFFSSYRIRPVLQLPQSRVQGVLSFYPTHRTPQPASGGANELGGRCDVWKLGWTDVVVRY